MTDYQLHLGDCMDVLPELADGTVDLTVTSPPYDNLREYGADFDADTFDWRGIIRELYRVTKRGGVVVWIVADATIGGSETGTSFRQALWAMDCGFNLHDTMIYQVAGTGAKGSNYAYWQAFEYMFVWSKGKPRAINRLRKKNLRAGTVVTRGDKTRQTGTRLGSYTVESYGVRPNVWRYHTGQNGDESTSHPAIFPESLARDHILSWSNPGDIVLDPLMGSGTTGKMALSTGRNFIGIEIDAHYHAIAERRIADAARQARGEFRQIRSNGDGYDDLPLFDAQGGADA